MKLGALYSGGKDSTFAIFKARLDGHEISCLVTVFPRSDESHLLHYPNIDITTLQAKAMEIPQLITSTDSDQTEIEISKLEKLLEQAKIEFGIEGVVHGGIRSDYQRKNFETMCKNLGLQIISPLWHTNQLEYLHQLLQLKFKFVITSVSTQGLDDTWLGKEITLSDVNKLDKISSKFGFDVSFEGGEAETFVTSCPLFSGTIKITKSKKIWDGYRGRFEITEAVLE